MRVGARHHQHREQHLFRDIATAPREEEHGGVRHYARYCASRRIVPSRRDAAGSSVTSRITRVSPAESGRRWVMICFLADTLILKSGKSVDLALSSISNCSHNSFSPYISLSFSPPTSDSKGNVFFFGHRITCNTSNEENVNSPSENILKLLSSLKRIFLRFEKASPITHQLVDFPWRASRSQSEQEFPTLAPQSRRWCSQRAMRDSVGRYMRFAG
ncbi:hypothetical protein KSP39_PZI011987 [Platanthera zijinensis]|uniref:Uncharacterized protein n=1 Tax=Platanthera zijinensis TaxID=2320716 RepID=A0AAP0BG06_9ASPA